MSLTVEEKGIQGTEDIAKALWCSRKNKNVMKSEFLRFNSSSITSCVVLGKFLNLSVPKFQHLSSGTNTLGVYVP